MTDTMVMNANMNPYDPLLDADAASEEENEENLTPPNEQDIRKAAGLTGAVVGMLAGPLGSVVLGFSAAYAAEQKEGPLGDSARSLGALGLSTQKKLCQLADKHKVAQRSSAIYDKANAYDPIGVVQKTTNLAQKGYKSTTAYCEEKKVMEKGKDLIGKNVCSVLEKVMGGNDKPTPPVES